MKKLKLITAILTIVLVFGLTLASCGSGDDGPSGPDEPGNGGDPGSGGVLTITGFPETYNGKFIFFRGDAAGAILVGCENISFSAATGITITLAPITNGSANLRMWDATNPTQISRLTGNYTTASNRYGRANITASQVVNDPLVSLGIQDYEIELWSTSPIVFTNGNATLTVNISANGLIP